MRYLVSFIIPPLGILMCGRWVHAIVNLLLWISSVFLIPVFGLGFFVWIAVFMWGAGAISVAVWNRTRLQTLPPAAALA